VKFTSELRDATCQWDHTVLSATRQRWLPAFTPTGQVGIRFIDPVRMKGWVGLVSHEWGVALYGVYVADVNLDSSTLKAAAVDCSTTWDGSEFQSFTVRTAKEWRNACVEEPTARNLNLCFALVLSSAATRPTCSGWIPTWPITTLYSKANLKSLWQLCKSCQPSSCNICVTLEVVR